VLTAGHRLRRRVDFSDTVRRGRRAARPTLVVHLLTAETPLPSAAEPAGVPSQALSAPPRAGFVVSRAVGPSVVRHLVTRRLRHLVAQRLGRLQPGSTLVVRALPPSASASSAVLGIDLDRALDRLLPVASPDRPGTITAGQAS